jgi:hypothetical protein
MLGEAVVEAAEVGVVFHVVGQGWDQSATAEATEAEARVTPAPNPPVRAGRVPYLTAAATPRVVVPSGRATGKRTRANARIAVPNARVTGKRNKANVRKAALIAGKIILVKGRSGVKITMVAT